MTLFFRTIECTTKCDHSVVLALANMRDLNYWHEYFRLLFKYRNNDATVGSLHTELLEAVQQSTTLYAKWNRYEQRKPAFDASNDEIPTNYEIKRKMQETYVKIKTTTYGESENFLCTKVFCNRERLISNKNWAPRQWLTNDEFRVLCLVFGGGCKLSRSKLCFRCGLDNSVEHSLVDCPLLKECEKVDLEHIFDNEKSCLENCEKIKKLLIKYNKAKLQMTYENKRVSVWKDKVMRDYILLASLRGSPGKYRAVPLDDLSEYVTLNVNVLKKLGHIFVYAETVNVEQLLFL